MASTWSRGSILLITLSMKLAPLSEASAPLLVHRRSGKERVEEVDVGGSDRPHEGHGSNCIVGMIHIDRDRVLSRRNLQARAKRRSFFAR